MKNMKNNFIFLFLWFGVLLPENVYGMIASTRCMQRAGSLLKLPKYVRLQFAGFKDYAGDNHTSCIDQESPSNRLVRNLMKNYLGYVVPSHSNNFDGMKFHYDLCEELRCESTRFKELLENIHDWNQIVVDYRTGNIDHAEFSSVSEEINQEISSLFKEYNDKFRYLNQLKKDVDVYCSHTVLLYQFDEKIEDITRQVQAQYMSLKQFYLLSPFSKN